MKVKIVFKNAKYILKSNELGHFKVRSSKKYKTSTVFGGLKGCSIESVWGKTGILISLSGRIRKGTVAVEYLWLDVDKFYDIKIEE